MKEINEKLLIKAAEELNELLFEPGDKDIINVDLEPDELAKQIKEAAELLKPDDELSKETTQVLADLREDEVKEKDETTIPKENDDLFAEVDNAERLKDLKEIAKANDEFKEIRGKLSKYKSTNELRTAMLDVLDELEKPEKTEKKKEEKKAEPKDAPKEKAKPEAKKLVEKKTDKIVPQEKSGMTRQTAVFVSIRKVCKKPSSVNKIAEEANSVYMKNNPESKGVSKLQNMSNVVRYSVLALVEFEILSEKNGKYFLQ